MSRVELNQPVPDFTLTDFEGNEVRLSDFQGRQNVLLVFNRGFF
jgi:peroxiredoxin